MNKHELYVAALEVAIQALDSAFIRANAAEQVAPLVPLSQRWEMSGAERERAERAEEASYNVTPDHWGARLALMSAFESLHAALRVISSKSAHRNPQASAWREAAARAGEAGRLAREAQAVLSHPGALAGSPPTPEAQPPETSVGTEA